MKFLADDKVIVKGLAAAFVVVQYLDDNLIKLRLEGESLSTTHTLICARPEVLLLNNRKNCIAEGWIEETTESSC
jgi:hypothetical protein